MQRDCSLARCGNAAFELTAQKAAKQEKKALSNKPLTETELSDAFKQLSGKFGGQGTLF